MDEELYNKIVNLFLLYTQYNHEINRLDKICQTYIKRIYYKFVENNEIEKYSKLDCIKKYNDMNPKIKYKNLTWTKEIGISIKGKSIYSFSLLHLINEDNISDFEIIINKINKYLFELDKICKLIKMEYKKLK